MNSFFTLLLVSLVGSTGWVRASDSTTEHKKAENHANHKHKKNCGHPSKKHGDHVDYTHDGHEHRKHGDHYDECSAETKASAPEKK
jgi:hypothetical protein